MPKLGLSGGRPRTRHENGVLLAYAAAPAKKYYVKLSKKVGKLEFSFEFHFGFFGKLP